MDVAADISSLRMPNGGETDTERVVGIDQIFFSTTEEKGRITGANQTFSNLSKYPLDELMSAPHSIIRHPDMPGGVFQIMWDRLHNSQPVAAYVKNRAKDGRLYWVFATVTPIPGGYISVRTRPVYEPLWQAADALYHEARPVELAAAAGGARRPQVAQAGIGVLASGLAAAGFDGYEEFMMEALPQEVLLRQKLSQQPPVNAEPGTALGAIVGGAQILEQRTGILLDLITNLGSVSSQMTNVLQANKQARDILWATSDRASVDTNQPGISPALGRSAIAIQEWVNRACLSLDELEMRLKPISKVSTAARFSIALTRLHNEMVMSFAYEVHSIDTGSAVPSATGQGMGARSIEFIPLLCETIVGDVNRLTDDLERMRLALNDAAAYIEAALEALQKTREFIASWQLMVGRYGNEALADTVEQMSVAQDQVQDYVVQLVQLANSCVEVFSQIDPFGILEPIPVIEAGAAELMKERGLAPAHVSVG